MSKKIEKDLIQLDLYELLNIDVNSDEKTIKKAYRKHALSCHPDKNRDNPDAKNEFNRLKKILEVLLDPGARNAYDRVLRGRKAAALRARESSSKSRKLKTELEERERKAEVSRTYSKITEEERLKRELKRLEEEGDWLIAEELDKVNQEAQKDLHRAFGSLPQASEAKKPGEGYRVKAKWTATDDWPGYNKEEIEKLFYKWGEIFAVVLKQKGHRGTALIEYKDKEGADMAMFEGGMPGKPIAVTSAVPEDNKEKKSKQEQRKMGGSLITPEDYEAPAKSSARREVERRRLIEEMMKNDKL